MAEAQGVRLKTVDVVIAYFLPDAKGMSFAWAQGGSDSVKSLLMLYIVLAHGPARHIGNVFLILPCKHCTHDCVSAQFSEMFSATAVSAPL